MASENKTDQIKADMFPDNTVTVIVKHDGKLYTKGTMLQEQLDKDGIYRSMARIKATTHDLLQTVFYVLGNQPQSTDMDIWYEREKRSRQDHDRSMGVVEEDIT